MPPLCAMDEYEPCLVEEGSTYCMLQLTLHAEPGNKLMHMITQYSDQKLIHYNHSIIEKGVCYKKTCQNYMSYPKAAKELRYSLEACLNHNMQREYGLNAKISTLYYCNKHNEPDYINAWDWTVLLVILGFIFINIVGSYYDYCLSEQKYKNHSNRNKAQFLEKRLSSLLCFSVKRNWRMLTSVTNDPQELHVFHGLRVLSNFCTIFFHVMLSYKTGFSRNPQHIEKLFNTALYFSLIGSQNIVQIFFYVSGFLAGYKLQKEGDSKKSSIKNLPKMIMMRVCRLLPALALTLALVTSWTRFAGSGPLWKLFVTGSLVADCRKSWWHHLLFVNNYVQGGKFCLLQTWQLAVEMQVYMVGVAAYLVSPRALLSLFLLSVVVPALHTAMLDLNPVIISSPETFRTLDNDTIWLQHVLGHNNLSCYVIGIITATQIYAWQKKGGHLVQSKWWIFLRHVSLASIPLVLYSGRWFHVEERRGVWVRAVYSGAIRVLLGLVCALMTYAFVNKTPSLLKLFLECRWWMVPSRLSYCVYLVHMTLVHMLSGSRTEPSIYSFSTLASDTLLVVAASYLLAILLHLIVEAPVTKLCKKLATKSSVNTSTIATDNKDK